MHYRALCGTSPRVGGVTGERAAGAADQDAAVSHKRLGHSAWDHEAQWASDTWPRLSATPLPKGSRRSSSEVEEECQPSCTGLSGARGTDPWGPGTPLPPHPLTLHDPRSRGGFHCPAARAEV